jgi:hypothetical protein
MIGELRKLLKGQDLLLNLLEVGCGSPISEAFMWQDGASNYIYGSASPYHKRAQQAFLGKQVDYRSVSAQFAYDACRVLIGESYNSGPKLINIAISMQVGYDKDNHGWICIQGCHLYHFSFGYNIGRTTSRDLIQRLVSDLIFYHYGEAPKSALENTRFIDGVFDCEHGVNLSNFNPKLMPERHAPFAIIDNKWMRLTEALRDWKIVNIVKGSFNPYHEAHQELMERFPGQSMLSITTKPTVEGKATITTAEAVKRVRACGQDAIIDSEWVYYSDLVSGLNEAIDLDSTELHFSMGVDTFARFTPIPGIQNHVFARNIDIEGTSFYVSKHPDVSSTKIRKNENS